MGSPSLLGRGGTDLTPLFLGHALGAAETRLVKDVNGSGRKRGAGAMPELRRPSCVQADMLAL